MSIRILQIALATSLLSACAPSHIATDYARYSSCPEEKVQVTKLEESRTGRPRYRASGCGNGAEYICGEAEDCVSPMIIVARRHAKQFRCGVDFVTVEYMDGGSWRASGCDHEMTYQCFETRDIVSRCIAETDDRGSDRRRSSEE
jgi:hypothetical protein